MNLVNVLATCAEMGITADARQITEITSLIIMIIQIVVPVLLIIWGMLDLGKAVMAQKDDEIKKGQQTFVKRLIAAAIVFFIVTIVKLVINLIAGNNSPMDCVNCFINKENCGW